MDKILPDDIWAFIFSKIPFIRKDKTWFHVMLTCRRFLSIGQRVFDPSIKNNWAIRLACEKGRSTDHVSRLLTVIINAVY